MKAVLDGGNEVELTYVGEGTSGVTYQGMIDEKQALLKCLENHSLKMLILIK